MLCKRHGCIFMAKITPTVRVEFLTLVQENWEVCGCAKMSLIKDCNGRRLYRFTLNILDWFQKLFRETTGKYTVTELVNSMILTNMIIITTIIDRFFRKVRSRNRIKMTSEHEPSLVVRLLLRNFYKINVCIACFYTIYLVVHT